MNKKLLAYCNSQRCTGDTYSLNMTNAKIKDVPFSKTNCPDCNAILIWRRPKQKMSQAERKAKAIRSKSDMSREFIL